MTQYIAHRGLSKLYPENTQVAFEKAWQAGCVGVELDIQVSQDNQVVVIHDPDTGRIAENCLVIADTNWEILKKIPIFIQTQYPQYLSTLVDIIAQVPTDKTVQIEVKQQINNQEALDAVIEVINTIRTDINIQVISFDLHKIITINKKCPRVACFYLLDESHPDVTVGCNLAREHGFSGIGLACKKLTSENIIFIKSKGLLIDTWTVNDIDLAHTLSGWGVDFIASDIANELHDVS